MNKKIKLLVVDLYGVMTVGNYWNTCRYLARKYKMDVNYLYDIVYHKYFNNACLGRISERDAFVKTIKELQLKETYQGLRDKHMSFQKINQSVLSLMLRLKKDYKIVLLSKNVPSQFKEVIKKYNLDKQFKAINTFTLKLDKKDSRVISYVLDKYKVKPSEVVMIDDQEFNLKEPEKIGVKTVHYKNFSDFRKRLLTILNK